MLPVIFGLAGAAYTVGWLRLRRRGGCRPRPAERRSGAGLAAGWRLSAYLGGLAVLALALLSPLDALVEYLFFAHMIQHLLLMMVAAPLLMLANPFPFVVWGLPGGPRAAGWLLRKDSLVRQALMVATRPGIVWVSFVAVLWGWHDPSAYNAALRNDWLHNLQHLSFFGVSLLLWWRTLSAGPRLQGRFPFLIRLGLLLASAAANMVPGVAIALAERPFYTYYLGVPRLWGYTPMQDQVLAGIIMWIPGTMMYVLAALALALRELHQPTRLARRRTPRPALEIEPVRP